MFRYSIDLKKEITDPDGNVLKDLAAPFFGAKVGLINDYQVIRMDDHYVMRPDKVSLSMYGSDINTEMILKFSGIGNPFTLSEEDVLMIPNESEAASMTAYETDDTDTDEAHAIEMQIRNYYKFVNQEYKSDSTSYDNLVNMNIPSGVITNPRAQDYIVPYISEDGRTAVVVRNGRMYFGEDSGIPSAADTGEIPAGSVLNTVQDALNKSLTKLSDTNCLYNGMSQADFIRAMMKNN